MADIRESFPTLEGSSGEGLPLHKVLEGDALAAKNASAGLVAKKASDNTLRYLQLDDAGNLKVTQDGGGTLMKDRGTAAGSATFVMVAEIALNAGEVYKGLSWVCSCFRDAIFEIVLIDDPNGTPSEEILADVICGPGDFTDSGVLKEMEFTAGATDPVLRVRAKNLNTTSDFRATISTTEDAA